MTASRRCDVYGAQRSVYGTATSAHRFVGSLGHTSDDATGLMYMRARYMDPATGAFVSEDPGHNGGNWFQYGRCSPTNGVDQDGKNFLWEILGGGLFFLLGIAAAALGWSIAPVFMVVAALLEVIGVLLALHEAYDDLSTILQRLNTQNREAGETAIVTTLKSSGDVALEITGWDLELTFAIFEIDET